MSTTRRWPRWPPSANCAPRSHWSRAPIRARGSDPRPAISKTADAEFAFWRITLTHAESATLEAALQSHHEALISQWNHGRDNGGAASGSTPPDAEHHRCVPAAGRDRMGP